MPPKLTLTGLMATRAWTASSTEAGLRLLTRENAVTGRNARPGESDCEIDLPAAEYKKV